METAQGKEEIFDLGMYWTHGIRILITVDLLSELLDQTGANLRLVWEQIWVREQSSLTQPTLSSSDGMAHQLSTTLKIPTYFNSLYLLWLFYDSLLTLTSFPVWLQLAYQRKKQLLLSHFQDSFLYSRSYSLDSQSDHQA